MTATIAVRMPNDVYLQRLRVLGAWWRLGSSALNPDLLIEHVEYGAFVTDIRHATCRVAAESGHGRPPDEELRPFNDLELDSGHRGSIPAGISAGPRGPVGRRYSRTLSGGGPMVVSTAVSQPPRAVGHFYGYTPVRTSVTYLHLLGILVGGGVAVSADRAALGLSPATPTVQELARLASVHRWVLGGLTLIFASGLLMMLAELDTLATSVVFWTKMGLHRAVTRQWLRADASGDRAPTGRRRRMGWVSGGQSVASLALWLAILLAGTLLHSTT